jgi:hypothetical protein
MEEDHIFIDEHMELHGDSCVESAKEVDVLGALDFSGERVAIIVLAHVGEVVRIVAKHTADGEWALPWCRQLMHALFV